MASSIEASSTYYLRGCYEGVPEVIVCACATESCITGSCVTGSREPEMKGRSFPAFFPAFFPGTPLDSRYEQWNCESNLYRVTIALLPHFPLLICAISRD